MSKTKVSVIMPSLNVAEYIDEAISSVRNQTLKDIEILCVDAESDDGTIDIIQKHVSEDPRVKYCPSDMRSYGHQLNIGIEVASGEYVGIVETDDYVDERMYEMLYSLAKEEKCDFVKADYAAFITQKNGEKFFLKRKNFNDNSIYDKVLCPKQSLEVAVGDWYNCQGIYDVNFIRKNRIQFSETPGAAFQDIGFLFYAIILANRVKYVRDSFYRYRIDRLESSSNSGRGIKYSYDEFKRLTEMLEASDKYDRDDYRVLYIRMAKSFITSYGDMSPEFVRIKDEERTRYYNWFKEKMEVAIENGIVTESDMQLSIWTKLKALLISEEKCKADQMMKEMRLIEWLKDNSGCTIVIFGCGNFGYTAHCTMKRNGITNDFFCDNNAELWGKELDEVPVASPNKLCEIKDNVAVVVANALYADDIRKQVLSMGIPENRIYDGL